MKAFLIMGRVLKAAWEDLFLCVFLSIAWWIGTFLVVTASPVTMGAQHVANRLANYKRADSSFFWEGARKNIGRGWLLFLVNILLPAAFLFNIWFYFNSRGYFQLIGVLWIWLFVFSLMIGQYVFPLLWQQDEPKLGLALRNAALLALQNPLYSLLILLFQLVLLVVSFALTLPAVLLAPALIALTGNFALCGLLQEAGLAPPPPETPAHG